MRLVHYYHCYAVNDWQRIASEHFDVLVESDLFERLDAIRVGIIGAECDRNNAAGFFRDFLKPEIIVQSETGWEQLTLEQLSLADDYDYAFYAHTKGVSHGEANGWRNAMLDVVVGGWHNCVDLLDDHDAVGPYWQSLAIDPNRFNPVFGGNYWWARRDYIERLPPIQHESRYDAEAWIGYGEPNIVDLLPGFPPTG